MPVVLLKVAVHNMVNILVKMSKKGDFKNLKVKNGALVLNQSPFSTVFPIVRFPGGAKTVLSGDPLYICSYMQTQPVF